MSERKMLAAVEAELRKAAPVFQKIEAALGKTETEEKDPFAAPSKGTVGYWNPETQKWEGGVSEQEIQAKTGEGSTLGVYNSETKQWIGGSKIKQLEPGPAKPSTPLR